MFCTISGYVDAKLLCSPASYHARPTMNGGYSYGLDGCEYKCVRTCMCACVYVCARANNFVATLRISAKLHSGNRAQIQRAHVLWPHLLDVEESWKDDLRPRRGGDLGVQRSRPALVASVSSDELMHAKRNQM